MLKSVVYVSTATHLFTQPELLELLNQARRNNERNEITGILLYKNGNFMQAFEGQEEAAMNLHAKIIKDPRHRDITTLLSESVKERQFSNWTMNFHNIDLLSDDAWITASPLLKKPFSKDIYETDPGSALDLLLTFRKI